MKFCPEKIEANSSLRVINNRYIIIPVVGDRDERGLLEQLICVVERGWNLVG